MFLGRHDHSIDSKGRIIVPAEYRSALAPGDETPIITNLQLCVALYPFDSWTLGEGEITTRSSLQPEFQAIQRFLAQGVSRCPIDKQGRALVPPELREHAGLTKRVSIIGAGPRVEIWDTARLEEDLARTKANFGELSAKAGLSTRQPTAGGAGENSPKG